MRVLLIVPSHGYPAYPSVLSFSDFPTGFGYIAGALKVAGHEVWGCNPNNKLGYKSGKEMIEGEICWAIQESKPDLIGMGGICTDYAFLRDGIEVVRKYSSAPVVLGGNIVTNDAEFIFKDLKPDYAVVGEGEEAIVSIANGCENKGIVRFPSSRYLSLDLRPLPDYEPFGVQRMIDHYSMATRVLYRYSRPYPRPYNLVASRSCPFSCTFCIHGHRTIPYRARSIESIMGEIKESYEKYKFNILILLDELFAVSKGRLKAFSEAILRGKADYGWDFDWCFQTHASARFDLDTLKLAKRAGCYFFSYGIESASPAVLKSMGKKTQVSRIVEAIKLAREAEIGFGGNLIFGDPAETLDTMRESLKFWHDYGQTEEIFLGFIVPYPGSKLFDDCLAKGIIPDKKTYYEALVHNRLTNMTKIPSPELEKWFNFIDFLEHSWAFVETTTMKRYEEETCTDEFSVITKSKAYKVYADCPICKREFMSRQVLHSLSQSQFFGIGCPHCNRKIRVNIADTKVS